MPMDELFRKILRRARVGGHTARMVGCVAFDQRGSQTVLTDSKIHPVLTLCGPSYATGAKPGDKVELLYRVHRDGWGLWYGRKL